MTKDSLHTPCYVVDVDALQRNLEILHGVMVRTGAKILLAQKAFSCYAVYPLVAKYLVGATASGLYEAKLCHEEMSGVENHIYNPAFQEKDMDEILRICDHIVFNSPSQLRKFGARAKAAGLQVGLRINPECSTQTDHAIYDPCAPGSRLGTTNDIFCAEVANTPLMQYIDGLHFHTLCEQDSDDLETTWNAFEQKFGKYLYGMKWVNFGGGHHITRSGYDIARLERLIEYVRTTYDVQVYLEPGEAIALNAGYLYTEVLEVQHAVSCDGEWTPTPVIVDASAACHMPDAIEMPYMPPLEGSIAGALPGEAKRPEEGQFVYRLGGPTCLAGDVIGDYTIDHALKEGDILRFNDLAIYSMVKNNTFNGMPLPSIYIKEGDEYRLWKEFGYQDFKCRI